jgi:hypothetical protein
MNDLDRLIQHYNAGNYTVTDLVLQTLQLITHDNADAILSSLPREAIVVLKQFVEDYRPGIRVFNAPEPKPDVVQIVKTRLGMKEKKEG